MKKTTLTILVIITISILLANVFTVPSKAANAVDQSAIDVLPANQTTQLETLEIEQKTEAPKISCAAPTQETIAECQAMEQEILNSTVRIMMYTPVIYVEGFGHRIVNGMGHGTIKDGRYLVTHNHYEAPLMSPLQQGDPDNLITIDIFDTSGELVAQLQGNMVSIFAYDKETLILDFGKIGELDFFTAHELPSANFYPQSSNTLTPGMEVAQIDWDGFSSHVDWVNIKAVTERLETPIVRTPNCIMPGASGGGVFLNGHHIGNNWSRSSNCNDGNPAVNTFHSSIALNPLMVVSP